MKKKLSTIIMTATLVLMGTAAAIPAYAADTDVNLEWTVLSSRYNCMHTDYVDQWPHANIRKYTIDGRTAFCIQANRAVRDKNGKSMTEYDKNSLVMSVGAQAASADDSQQSKIAYLGYYANTHSDQNYAFTQMFIWQSLPLEDRTSNGRDSQGRYRSYFEDSSVRSEYEAWKKNIQAKIDAWNVKPSFDASTQPIKAGTSITLTDSRGVFADYNTFNCTADGLTLRHTKGSNELTVTADKSCAKPSVTLTEKFLIAAGGTKYSNAYDTAYTYTGEKTQNMATYGVVSPCAFSLAFKVATIGNLRLSKTSEAGFVAGISFTVEKDDGSYKTTVATGEDGSFVLEGIPAGTYTVTEITPPGFLPQEPQTVTVLPGQTAEVRFANSLIKGHISLIKYGLSPLPKDDGGEDEDIAAGGSEADDADEENDGTHADDEVALGGDDVAGGAEDGEGSEGEPLAGAVYEIVALDDFPAADGSLLQQAGETVDTLVTDENGFAKSKDLYLGRYAVREVRAPAGFWLSDEETIVEITAEQRELQIKATDEMKIGAFRAMMAMEPLAFDHSISTVIPQTPTRVPAAPNVPKTGDSDGLLSFLALAALAAAATTAAALKAVGGGSRKETRK